MRRRRALILFMLMAVFVIVLDVVTIRFMDRKQSKCAAAFRLTARSRTICHPNDSVLRSSDVAKASQLRKWDEFHARRG